MIINYLRLIRPLNLGMLGLMQSLLVGFVLPEYTDKFSWANFFVPMFSVLLIAGAGYVINDYYDQSIDAVNKPEKRWIGTKISEKNALRFYFSLNFLAISLVIFHPIFLVWNIFFGFILWIYARFLKKMPFIGNLVVAFCVSGAVWTIQIPYVEIEPKIVFFSIFAWFSNLIREIIKDFEDECGDKIQDSRTLPIVLGHRHTKILVAGLACVFGIVLLLSSAVFGFGNFLAYVIFADILLIWSVYQLFGAQTDADYRQLSRFYKLLMFSGILSVVL